MIMTYPYKDEVSHFSGMEAIPLSKNEFLATHSHNVKILSMLKHKINKLYYKTECIVSLKKSYLKFEYFAEMINTLECFFSSFTL